MKVNFEKTDRLIELMVDGSIVINGIYYKGAYEKKHSDNPVFRNLYAELVEITKSDISEDEKHLKRLEAFEKAYSRDGEGALKFVFDEERFVKRLTEVYRQLPSMWGKITDTTGNNFADKEGLKRFVDKYYPNELYKDIIVEVVSNQEPTIKDIEKEFWENCPDVDKIDQWCDIYWQRFKDHLKNYDEDYYEYAMDKTDKDNLLFQYFQDLRLTGLLKTDNSFVEVRLYHIVQSLNYTSNSLSELFEGFRRLGQRSISQPTQPDERINDKSFTGLSKSFKLREGITEHDVIGYYKCLFDNKAIVCSENDWKALFSNDKLPDNWNPIGWFKKKTKGDGLHLTWLGAIIRHLLDVPKGKKHEETMSQFFVDEKNIPLKPSLPSVTNIDVYLMSEIEKSRYLK